jgi:hypothetical protein
MVIGRFYWLNSKCFNVLTCLNIDIYIYIIDIIYILIHNCIIPSLFCCLSSHVLKCVATTPRDGTRVTWSKAAPDVLVAQKWTKRTQQQQGFCLCYSCRCTISINIYIGMNNFYYFFIRISLIIPVVKMRV